MEMNHHCIYLKCFVCSLLDETSGKLASVVQADHLVCFSQSGAGAELAVGGKVLWLLRGGTCSPARAVCPPVKRGGAVASWAWQVSGLCAGLSACTAGNAFFQRIKEQNWH